MKRTEMINEMVEFYESIPDGASSYHKMDMLLSRLERLKMLPPVNGIYNPMTLGRLGENKWEPENET